MKVETCDGYFWAYILPSSDSRSWFVWCCDDNDNGQVVYEHGTYSECKYVIERFLVGTWRFFIDHNFCGET